MAEYEEESRKERLTRSYKQFSTKVLSNNLQKYTNELNELIATDPHNFRDCKEIQLFINRLKEIRSLYNKTSREISANQTKAGATQEAFDTAESRHEFTLECREAINIANTLLEDKGGEAMSMVSDSTFINDKEPEVAGYVHEATAAEKVAQFIKGASFQQPQPTRVQESGRETTDRHVAGKYITPEETGFHSHGPASQLPEEQEFRNYRRFAPHCQDSTPFPGVSTNVNGPRVLFKAEQRNNVPFFTVGRPPQPSSNFNFPPQNNPPVNPNGNVNNDQAINLQAAMSKMILTQDLFKHSIDTFDGTAHYFWSWVDQVQARVHSLGLTRTEILRVMESHCTGAPKQMLKNYMAGAANINEQYFQEIWNTLVERYGSPYKIAAQLLEKLKVYPPIKGAGVGRQLQDLHDLCMVIQYNMNHARELSILNLAVGMKILREKLPRFLADKWRTQGHNYEDQHGCHPPFTVFVSFLKKHARELSNANYEDSLTHLEEKKRIKTMVTLDSGKATEKETTVSTNIHISQDDKVHCPIHKADGHKLVDCRVFQKLNLYDRKKKLIELKLCFLCFDNHLIKDCTTDITCEKCAGRHSTLLHREPKKVQPADTKTVLCTRSESKFSYKNCSKTVLVDVFFENHRENSIRCYAIIDEQSDCTLLDPKLLHLFNRKFPEEEYLLSTVNGCETITRGMVVNGLCVKGVREERAIQIPLAYENGSIPDTRHEVATPSDLRQHKNLKHLANRFPEFDTRAELLLLIGRNCSEAMKTVCLSKVVPFVHHTSLGYALVGETCSPLVSKNKKFSVLKVQIDHEHFKLKQMMPDKPYLDLKNQKGDVFASFRDDNSTGMSQNDEKFVTIMKKGIKIREQGRIEAPIPFKNDDPLPNNKLAVKVRTENMLKRLARDQLKLSQCKASMQKDIDAGYIEELSPEEEDPPVGKGWWLPVFSVCSAHKPKARLVFDAAAQYSGTSLNDHILSGPDLNNPLRAILLRFRENNIALVADIEAMFKNFTVPGWQRNYLRFFWYANNNEEDGITEYRGTTHLFGLTSSPSVATYCLRFAADQEISDESILAINFIKYSIYVDDALHSVDSIDEAVNILNNAINILAKYGIRLHKILASSKKVLDSFPESERAEGCQDLQLDGQIPTQRTLGILWNPEQDAFLYDVNIPPRKFTKRGILSVTNSLYDPLGLVAPVSLAARLIQRKVLPPKRDQTTELELCGWDDDLPAQFLKSWEDWKTNLQSLTKIRIPRCYLPFHFTSTTHQLHVFADASDEAIGFVIYLRALSEDGEVAVSLVTAGSKVAPQGAVTTPRLELCAAQMAAVHAAYLIQELTVKFQEVNFYSDSQVVLGYLHNTQKRFQKYVGRRVGIILSLSAKEQWKYVNTVDNPGDLASRPQTPEQLQQSIWFTGPEFLHQGLDYDTYKPVHDQLPEEVVEKTVLLSCKQDSSILTNFCNRVNNWFKVLRVLIIIKKLSKKFDSIRQKFGIHLAQRNPETTYEEATKSLICLAQQESYAGTSDTLLRYGRLPENHPLSDLTPFIDREGLMRVGGRVQHSSLPPGEKHPLLLPEKHAVTSLIINHLHATAGHQGRHLTHGIIRQHGYHIYNGKKVVGNLIKNCTVCRQLRGIPVNQQMAELPRDRLEEAPPFSNTGLDVFGHFYINEGKNTRSTTSTKKVWVLIFVCLVSRAVHLELLPGLDTTSMRNALFRFTALRGVCKMLRSDNGTNFLAARNQMVATRELDVGQIQRDMLKRNCQWIFNPPMASHFSGAWERKIASVRRVFEGTLLTLRKHSLNRDEFLTLMIEASSIVNNTPLWEVSQYPDDPIPLSPASLLTLRDSPNPPLQEEYQETDFLRYGKARWRRIQYLAQQFWVRYRKDYLHTLQKRRKWKNQKTSIKVGDVVLIRNKTEKRNCWPMARVAELYSSGDNLVRKVLLNLPNGRNQLVRAIHDLVLITSCE